MAAPGTRNDERVTPIAHDFDDAQTLAHTLARDIANRLRDALTARGAALLAVSGGNTPQRFLDALAHEILDWQRVTVTLTDERRVPLVDARSNEAMVRAHLLQGPAAAAALVSLHVPDDEDGIAEVAARIDALPLPFDAVVLGMGLDGHCASLFPGADHLESALRPDGSARVMEMRAPAAPEPRITLTLPALVAARAMYVLIEGRAKKGVLERCLRERTPFAQAPVRAVLENARSAPHVYWCP